MGSVGCLKDAIGKWILNAEKGNFTVVTSFDISSAFPCLDTKLVIQKMKSLGVQQKSLEWFENYLDFRIITTKVDNEIVEKFGFYTHDFICLS